LEQLGGTEKPERQERKFERKFASTRSIKKEGGCVVCRDERHREKVFFCKRFKEFKLAEKVNAIKKLGACKRCLGCHKEMMNVSAPTCAETKTAERGAHQITISFSVQRENLGGAGKTKVGETAGNKRKLTEEQEKFMAELSPEMAENADRLLPT